MNLLTKTKQFFLNLLSQIRFFFSSKNNSHKIIISLIHTGLLIWACIISFTYSGCLESDLLCPRAYFTIPYTSISLYIYSELPLLATVIILSTVNITALFALNQVKRFNYIFVAITITLFIFSMFFITSYVRFGSALQQEIQRLQDSGELITP